jgi:hypothetical protein
MAFVTGLVLTALRRQNEISLKNKPQGTAPHRGFSIIHDILVIQ